MGIPFYYVSLLKSHPNIVRSIKKINVDILAIDFNCLIHKYLKDESPIESVIEGLELVLETCKSKKVFISFDGLVPYGKIVQQRYRRMCKKDIGEFDRNQISPDTPFMRQLEIILKQKFPEIEISPTQKSGEGEHKIFNDIRKYEKVDSICIYGLDADLILLSLYHHTIASKEMFLLRESQELNSEGEFSILVCKELAKILPIDIKQYLILCVMCFGNDFMPNLGMFSLREGGYERALEIYDKIKPNLLEEEGRYNFLLEASKTEWDFFSKRRTPFEKNVIGKDPQTFSKRYGLHVLDGTLNMENVVEAYWKTFHWSLDYFTNNKTTNWNWVYPYPDAPLIQDIVEFYETKYEKQALNFTISKQLSFILPSKSLKLCKKIQKYPDEIYENTRPLWIKKHTWEMKPYISLPWNPNGITEVFPL
jgi:5'-3' exonuclease